MNEMAHSPPTKYPNYHSYTKIMTSTEEPRSSVFFSDVSHPQHLLTTFQELRSHADLCDVVLLVGETKIPAHKIVLAGSSPYFRAMFTSGLTECHQREICLHEMEETAFVTIIDYFYTCKLEITESNVQDILSIAGVLQIRTLQEACCEFLKRKITWENCLGIAAFADSQSCNHLLESAQSFAINHFVDVVQSEEFMNISCQQLCKLVHDDMLNVHTEERVFEAVLAWIKFDINNRAEHARELFSRVRFPLLSAEFLMDRVANEDVIRNNRECCDLLLEATRFHLLPPQKSRATPHSPRLCPRKPTSVRTYLYAIGGMSRREAMKTGERFDIKEGKWKPIGDMSVCRWGADTAAIGPHVYVCGGSDNSSRLNTAERYDPFHNVWIPITPMNSCRNGVGIVSLGGRVYAIGGFNGEKPFNTCEMYDPKYGKWVDLPSMQEPRLSFGCCVLNEQIYAIGGSNGSNIKSCEKFDPSLNKWISIAAMATARKQLAVAALGGYIYAIGGIDHQDPFRTVERYDPSTDRWVDVAPLPTARSGAGVGVMDGFIYVCGGFDGTQLLNTVEKYDPLTNQWHPSPPMNHARDGPSICVASSKRPSKRTSGDQLRAASPVPSMSPSQGYNST